LKKFCWKCKSTEVEPSEPANKLEEKLSVFLPLQVYDCSECEKRFLWFTDPLMDRTRTIFAGVAGGILLLMIIFSMMGGEEKAPIVIEEQGLSETALKYDLPLEGKGPAEAADTTDTANTTATAEGAAAATPEEDAATADPVSLEPPPGTVPEPGEVWSSRVKTQLVRNLAKMRGEAAPATPTEETTSPSPTPRPKQNTASAGSISALQGSELPDHYILKVLNTSRDSQPKGSYAAKDKYMVDLPGDWQVAPTVGTIRVNGTLVTRVRVGRHPNYFRIVFDLNGEIKLKVDYTQEDGALAIRLSQ